MLGSTGSLGRQTLDVIRQTPGTRVAALTANNSTDVLEKQIKEFNPDIAALWDESAARELRGRLTGHKTEILSGKAGVLAAAGYDKSELVVNVISGTAGLEPTIAAIKAGKDVALANKETLVAAGGLVTALAKERGVSILPVDSEHSAIFQCLRGNDPASVSKLILTASGGPFRGYDRTRLAQVTVAETLNHPVWSMGRKITVDCATLMNKGLEVMEAYWFFGLSADKIDVVIHPQSVVHSMVEFNDGAVMAQMGTPDMRLPIQYAINYPDRLPNNIPKLDLFVKSPLTFEKPDLDAFPCLRLAYDALKTGGTAPAVLNAADETAVNLFINGEIRFDHIYELIENTLLAYTVKSANTLDDVLLADSWGRETTARLGKTVSTRRP